MLKTVTTVYISIAKTRTSINLSITTNERSQKYYRRTKQLHLHNVYAKQVATSRKKNTDKEHFTYKKQPCDREVINNILQLLLMLTI